MYQGGEWSSCQHSREDTQNEGGKKGGLGFGSEKAPRALNESNLKKVVGTEFFKMN